MKQLEAIAQDLSVSERTLRRACNQGLLRAQRPSTRKLRLDTREESYVRRYWHLLGGLREVLRTEHNVRLAVLFGSVARAEDHDGSDFDILVEMREPDARTLRRLRRRIESALGREAGVVRLDWLEADSPLIADIARDGRVLVDRDGRWLAVRSRARRARMRSRELDAELLSAHRASVAASVRERA